MKINYQKNYNQPIFQVLKTSETSVFKLASLVKKVALVIINLLLIPFKLAQKAYCKLFRVKVAPKAFFVNNFFDRKTSIRDFIGKNLPSIIKTALIGVGASTLIAFGFKGPSAQSKQLANIPTSLFKNIHSNDLVGFLGCSALVVYGFVSFKQNNEKSAVLEVEEACTALNSTPPKPDITGDITTKVDRKKHDYSKLPFDLLFNISQYYLGDARAFNVAVKLRKEAIQETRNNIANTEIDKILAGLKKIEIPENQNYFEQILNNEYLSFDERLEIIKNHVSCELRFIGGEKIEKFAKTAIEEISRKLEEIETSEKHRGAFERILNNITLTYDEKLDKIKNYISNVSVEDSENFLEFVSAICKDSLKVENLILEETKLPKSIIDYLQSPERENLIASSQIHFADELISELRDLFPSNNDLINEIDNSIKFIKKLNKPLLEKANEINATIIRWLNPESGSNPLKTSVTTLNLSESGLIEVLPCISQFENLEDLDLSDNSITALPESFGNLENLQTLNLSDNYITYLPESFGNLEKLQTLNLNNNQITYLPESFDNLGNLQTLNLNVNQITYLPEVISKLSLLTRLSLNGNELASIPDDFFLNLKDLFVLDLSNNRLRQLPSSIKSLPNLQPDNLHTSGNMLEEEH